MTFYLRLEGGAADEDGMSSSGSLDRLRPLRATAPLFAADILGRSGELKYVSSCLKVQSKGLGKWRSTSLETNTLRSIFAEVGEEQEIDLRDCFRTVEEGRVKLEGCQLVRGVWCSRRVTRS